MDLPFIDGLPVERFAVSSQGCYITGGQIHRLLPLGEPCHVRETRFIVHLIWADNTNWQICFWLETINHLFIWATKCQQLIIYKDYKVADPVSSTFINNLNISRKNGTHQYSVKRIALLWRVCPTSILQIIFWGALGLGKTSRGFRVHFRHGNLIRGYIMWRDGWMDGRMDGWIMR